MIFEKDLTFHLKNDVMSYIMTVKNGYLVHLYYGKAIQNQSDYQWLLQEPSESVGNAVFINEGDSFETLSRYRLEYPTFGEGDYREPALIVEDLRGSRMCSLKYKDHKITKGKPVLKGLPATWTKEAEEAETLEIELVDEILGLKVFLRYSVFSGTGALTRQAEIVNMGTEVLQIKRALSGSMDFADDSFEMTGFYGDWIKERRMDKQPLRKGIQKLESKKGLSSSWQNPFFMLSRKGAMEHTGEVYGFALVYSGNFMGQCEVDPHNVLRVQMGISDFDFSWQLEPNQSFETPEWLLIYSNKGFNGMSQISHHLMNNHLTRGKWRHLARPVLVNNWEATYFDFNEEKLLALADSAALVGVELFVLDDGWFKGRNDDTTSLGDWTVDLDKLPSGIGALSKKIKAKGLSFGLWVEPEMVSIKSDLYDNHPDWVIKTIDRIPKHGRNQFVLDLSRSEVVDYLFETFSQVFKEADVDYVKWDMNRTFSDLFSVALPANQQKEIGHRYILGLYRLMENLVQTFPHVLFEFCASGGNRFDPGMLYYMPQGWTSDNTDAIERQLIQYATSYAYPVSAMGAHVSAIPNHQTGRMTPLETRFATAIFGVLGYELDLTKLDDTEIEAIKSQIAYYKANRELLQFGEFYRLVSPYEGNYTAWMSVSKDKSKGLLGYYKKITEANPPYKRIKMSGLDASATYKISGAGVMGQSVLITGDALMSIGLPLKPEYSGTAPTAKTWWFGDFGASLFEIERV